MDARDRAWLDAIRYATLDLSGPWRLAFDTMLPEAVQAQSWSRRCKGGRTSSRSTGVTSASPYP